MTARSNDPVRPLIRLATSPALTCRLTGPMARRRDSTFACRRLMPSSRLGNNFTFSSPFLLLLHWPPLPLVGSDLRVTFLVPLFILTFIVASRDSKTSCRSPKQTPLEAVGPVLKVVPAAANSRRPSAMAPRLVVAARNNARLLKPLPALLVEQISSFPLIPNTAPIPTADAWQVTVDPVDTFDKPFPALRKQKHAKVRLGPTPAASRHLVKSLF